MASSFEFWVPDRKVYRAVNVDGMRNMMEAALAAGVSKVVSVSTGAVYGSAEWPITEGTEVGDYRPSEYAQTKYEGDLVAWELYRERGLPLVVLYPAAVLGPNDTKAAGRYLENIARGRMPAQILTDVPFPFVHVHDVCQAILLALEKEDNIGEKYFVCAKVMTWGEFNSLVCDVAGSSPPSLNLPDWLMFFSARVATALSSLTKRPPMDLAIDQVLLMKQGFIVDGSKIKRELGLEYQPVRMAVEQAIEPLGFSRNNA